MGVKKSDNKEKKSKKSGTIVSDKVGNYEKHPFFVRKKAAAKSFLKEVGLPPVLVKKEQN